MAQLVEWLLPTPEIRGLNPNILSTNADRMNSSEIGFGTVPEGSAQADMKNNQAFPMNIVVRRATVCVVKEKKSIILLFVSVCVSLVLKRHII